MNRSGILSKPTAFDLTFNIALWISASPTVLNANADCPTSIDVWFVGTSVGTEWLINNKDAEGELTSVTPEVKTLNSWAVNDGDDDCDLVLAKPSDFAFFHSNAGAQTGSQKWVFRWSYHEVYSISEKVVSLSIFSSFAQFPHPFSRFTAQLFILIRFYDHFPKYWVIVCPSGSIRQAVIKAEHNRCHLAKGYSSELTEFSFSLVAPRFYKNRRQ